MGNTEGEGPQRLPTGIPGLDPILGGGLWAGGVYLVQGAPGTGKTILANQLCAAAARRGSRALYVSLLAESFAGMLQHLRGLDFYEPGDAGNRIVYLSAFAALEEGGLAGILSLLRNEVHRHAAALVVIDAMVPPRDAATTEILYKRRLLDLQALSALHGFTTVMLGLPPANDEPALAVQIADGVIELGHNLVGVRSERSLVVRKFRGSATLRGRHAFSISGAGITVYPRLEADIPEGEPAGGDARLPVGISGLDAMLGGGLPACTTTCLIGPPGSGKTSLGLQFVAGCTRESPGVLFGFFESPAALRASASTLGIDLAAREASGALHIVWQPQGEHLLDALAHRLLGTAHACGARRVFIDGYEGFAQAATDRERMTRFMTALSIKLRSAQATVLMSVESEDTSRLRTRAMVQDSSAVADNIVVLRHLESGGHLTRLIAVGKLRGAGFDPAVHAFSIGRAGIVIGDEWTAGTAGLTLADD